MKTGVAVLCWAGALAAQQASVEGVAVHAISGEPLVGVHVRLTVLGFQGAGVSYGAISDAKGRFSMAEVAPGGYVWMPEYRGFIYAGKSPGLTLKPGQRLADFRLEMTPRAVITGRVLDQYGDPVPFIDVDAVPVRPEDTRYSMSAMADDRGEYRLRTAPGQYRIKVDPSQSMMPGSTDVNYGETWYPSAASAERAAVIDAAPGSDAGDIDIRLLRQQTFTVSGFVRGIPEGGLVTVTMQSGESPNSLYWSTGTQAGPDGSFSFPRLQPGFHRLFAQVRSGAAPLQSRLLDLNLEGDLSGVELTLAPGGELTGKLEIAGVPPGGRTVRLRQTDGVGMPQPTGGEVDAEGGFQIRNVPPGRFRVKVEPLPEDAYIAAVSLDDAVQRDGLLDLSHSAGGGKLKVTVAPDGARVSGTVRNSDGEPLAGATTVFLVSDPARMQQEEMVRSSDGSFAFKGLRPGRYRLFAIAPFWRPPGPIKEMAAAAPEIEVKKGERLTRDIKIDATKP